MTPRVKPAEWPQPPKTANAGLWLDKYIGRQQKADDTKDTRRNLVRQVAEIAEPADYADFFALWKAALAAWPAGRTGEQLLLANARVRTRMVVGLGAESVLETAIHLHRTYGVPVIPGSALKGLARSYALHRLDETLWGAGSDAFKIVFGLAPTGRETGQERPPDDPANFMGAGYVTFFDALYVPGSGFDHRGLHVDVLAVHHKRYYEGAAAPADWDSPTVVPFLSATGAYLIALGGPADWAAAALRILTLALAELGVGGKTSSGYGRMIVTPLTGATPFPQTVRPGDATAGGIDQAPPPVAPPLTWRRAKVREFQPKGGRLVDAETNEEFTFRPEAVQDKGNMPGKGAAVEYALGERGGKVVVVAVRRTR